MKDIIYTFVPNDFFNRLFYPEFMYYSGSSITGVLREAMGSDNYDQFSIAQDPMPHNGEVSILTNTVDPLQQFGSVVIGVIIKHTEIKQRKSKWLR